MPQSRVSRDPGCGDGRTDARAIAEVARSKADLSVGDIFKVRERWGGGKEDRILEVSRVENEFLSKENPRWSAITVDMSSMFGDFLVR